MIFAELILNSRLYVRVAKFALFLAFFAGIIGTQFVYDRIKINAPAQDIPPSADFIKSFDLGLHSAWASYLWLNVRLQLPFMSKGLDRYLSDINTINELDPRFATPYAISVIVMPHEKHPDWTEAAIEIGKRGVEKADPDWRIPFYLAADYYLYLRNRTEAAKYFDIAARTPGIPENVRTYAINYGLFPSIRQEIKLIWKAIYESTEDELVKERAKAYIEHFEIVDMLENAIKIYKNRYGQYPARLEDLVEKNIIKEIPKSPFGFEFKIYKEKYVGIKSAE